MTDQEIVMTLCIAQMAATLEAGDRAAQPPPSVSDMNPVSSDPAYYVERARALYEAAVANVSGPFPSQPDTKR